MFTRPEAGWVKITIGNWTDRASYLTRVHKDFLDALIDSYNNYRPCCISCDAEGWEYIIVIDFNYTYVIISKDEEELKTIEISRDRVAEECLNDMERDIDAWARWDFHVENEEDAENEKIKLLGKIEKLKEAIKEYHRR